jgi:hypothetical protein
MLFTASIVILLRFCTAGGRDRLSFVLRKARGEALSATDIARDDRGLRG